MFWESLYGRWSGVQIGLLLGGFSALVSVDLGGPKWGSGIGPGEADFDTFLKALHELGRTKLTLFKGILRQIFIWVQKIADASGV